MMADDVVTANTLATHFGRTRRNIARLERVPASDKKQCSYVKCECLRFDADEGAAERANRCMRISRFCPFQVDEGALDPGRKMPLEEVAVGAVGGGDAATGEDRTPSYEVFLQPQPAQNWWPLPENCGG